MLSLEILRTSRFRRVAIVTGGVMFAAALGIGLVAVRSPSRTPGVVVVAPACPAPACPEAGAPAASPFVEAHAVGAPAFAAPADARNEVEPAVVGTTCPSSVATIGVPIRDDTEGLPARAERRAAAAGDGCTLVVWGPDPAGTVDVSWDAGQTFSTIELAGEIVDVAAADARVVIVRRDGMLGTVRPGAKPQWRKLPDLTATHVLAAAQLTVIVQTEYSGTTGHTPPLASTIAYSDDDGARWRYLRSPIPFVDRASLDARGTLTVRQRVHAPSAPGGDVCGTEIVMVRSFETKLATPRWTRSAGTTWSYEPDSDHSCDHFSESFLVALRGRERVNVSGAVRSETDGPLWTVGSYGVWRNRLFRLRGRTAEQIGTVPSFWRLDPVGIDREDTLIAIDRGNLVRWSRDGGWRLLFPTSSVSAP